MDAVPEVAVHLYWASQRSCCSSSHSHWYGGFVTNRESCGRPTCGFSSWIRLPSPKRVVHVRSIGIERSSESFLEVLASLGSQTLLEGTDLDSNSVVLRPQRSGMPVVIYSVDPDCKPCISNIPFLNELMAERACPVNVLGVLARNPHLIDEARRLHSVGFPILRVSSGRAWSIFPLAESPTLVALDASGHVIDWWQGELTLRDKEQVRSELRASCSQETR